MVQEQIGGNGTSTIGIDESVGGIEAKRAKIRFNRANNADTNAAFADTSRPARKRGIPKEKRTEVSIDDTRPNDAKEVKGKPPSLADIDSETPKRRTRQSTKPTYPSLVDAENQAKFLLSAIEITAVTAIGPTGEMSEWERGMMQAPLQRCLARIPLEVLSKGGLIVDLGFLTMGGAIYFARIGKGIKLPDFSRKQKAGEVREDIAAPVSAPAHQVVDDIKPGDRDGLAVPIPTVIQSYMNGAI